MADEPTANLDSGTSSAIRELMKQMNRELKTTFVFSTHDQDIVNIADHVVRIQDGLVVEDFKAGKGGGLEPNRYSGSFRHRTILRLEAGR